MRAKVAILYEDEHGAVRGFPLHTLVSACVADTLGCHTDEIAPLLRAVPKKGDSKLLTACKDEVPRMREPNVFALFDADGLHRLLKLPGNTSPRDQLAALCSQLPDPRLRVFLLDRNTETLVAAAADCLGDDQPPSKNTLIRDKLFGKAAWGSRASRDCIRDKVPSFDGFIAELIPLIGAQVD
jgi:hypothetical protein